jgi:hypothetical protein
MKRALKLILPVMVALGAIVGGIFFLMRPVVIGDITAGFAEDVRSYVMAHHGSLPTDWIGFSEWIKQAKGSDRWKPEDLSARFAIRSTTVVTVKADDHPVEIIDPSLIGMQDYLDRALRSAAMEIDTVPAKP